MVRYSRSSPSTSLTSFFSTVPAPWWGYTTLSPTSNTPRALPSSGLDMRLTHKKRRLLGGPAYAGQFYRKTRPETGHNGHVARVPVRPGLSPPLPCGCEGLESSSGSACLSVSTPTTPGTPFPAASPPARPTATMPSFAHSSRRRSRLGGRPQTPREAELPERGDTLAERCRARGGRDRECNGEIGARLVDAHAAGDVDEHVGRPERDPPRGDRGRQRSSRAASGRHRFRRGGASRDRFERRAPGPRAGWGLVPSRATATARADLAGLASARRASRGRERQRALRRSSRTPRARWSSRTGSWPRAGSRWAW